MYRNRSNHRNMIEKMLAVNYQEAPPQQKEAQSQGQGQIKDRDAQFFRKRNIFKLYKFIRENQRM
jgi:hypothetical protein